MVSAPLGCSRFEGDFGRSLARSMGDLQVSVLTSAVAARNDGDSAVGVGLTTLFDSLAFIFDWFSHERIDVWVMMLLSEKIKRCHGGWVKWALFGRVDWGVEAWHLVCPVVEVEVEVEVDDRQFCIPLSGLVPAVLQEYNTYRQFIGFSPAHRRHLDIQLPNLFDDTEFRRASRRNW